MGEKEDKGLTDVIVEKLTNIVKGEDKVVGLYKHHKGGMYVVLCVGLHSETQDDVVIYRSVETSQTWVRSYAMFFEDVMVNGQSVPRFEKIKA